MTPEIKIARDGEFWVPRHGFYIETSPAYYWWIICIWRFRIYIAFNSKFGVPKARSGKRG